jgi:hypothetical protein
MELEKKIHAVNEINRITELNLNHVLPQLTNFINQKIYLVNGATASKFNITFIRETPAGYNGEYALLQNCYLNKSYRSVYLKVSGCFKNNEHSCFYEDTSVWVADLDDSGQVLTKVREEPYEFKTYDVDEIRTLLKRKDEIGNELAAIRSKLNAFVDF